MTPLRSDLPEFRRTIREARIGHRGQSIVVAAALALSAWVQPAPALATGTQTFTVNQLSDAVDSNVGDGTCDVDPERSGAQCSLRAAVQEANAHAGADTIRLPAGTIRLTITGQDAGASRGDLNLTDPSGVTIRGAGKSSTIIDARAMDDRVFLVNNSGVASISRLTVTGGAQSVGGGMFIDGSSGGGMPWLEVDEVDVRGNIANYGGGIGSIFAFLQVTNSTIRDNEAQQFGGGIVAAGFTSIATSTVRDNVAPTGGGIANLGMLRLDRSTIGPGNGSPLDGDGEGGGLVSTQVFFGASAAPQRDGPVPERLAGLQGLIPGGPRTFDVGLPDRVATDHLGGGFAGVYLLNSTIAGNTATYGGGATFWDDGGDTPSVLENVTVAGNSATEGGGLYIRGSQAGAVSVGASNSIIGSNIATRGAADCSTTIVTAGGNIDSDNTCGFTEPTDNPGVDPRLGSLASNGGPTQTRALRAGSPAIDGGQNEGCPDTDQRGSARPVDGNGDRVPVCDSGAYEYQPGSRSDEDTHEDAAPSGSSESSGGDARVPMDNVPPPPPPPPLPPITGGVPYEVNLARQAAGGIALQCDWNGDGVPTLGIFSSGTWLIRNAPGSGPAEAVFLFGAAGDTPVCGDWDGNGTQTPGIMRGNGWALRNSTTAGDPDLTLSYGNPGDRPVVCDWDGNRTETVGVFRQGTWYLRSSNAQADGDSGTGFVYGQAGDLPVCADWDGNGSDSPGYVRNGTLYLRNSNTSGEPERQEPFPVPAEQALITP